MASVCVLGETWPPAAWGTLLSCCSRKVNAVAQKQLGRLWHTSSLFFHSPIHEFAEKLSALLPEPLKVRCSSKEQESHDPREAGIWTANLAHALSIWNSELIAISERDQEHRDLRIAGEASQCSHITSQPLPVLGHGSAKVALQKPSPPPWTLSSVFLGEEGVPSLGSRAPLQSHLYGSFYRVEPFFTKIKSHSVHST